MCLDRALKSSDSVEDKPNSHKYEHGPWGIGDARCSTIPTQISDCPFLEELIALSYARSGAITFTIPTTGMPPKSTWSPDAKSYQAPDFITGNTCVATSTLNQQHVWPS